VNSNSNVLQIVLYFSGVLWFGLICNFFAFVSGDDFGFQIFQNKSGFLSSIVIFSTTARGARPLLIALHSMRLLLPRNRESRKVVLWGLGKLMATGAKR
jgi:hypothetical protein